jgi:hypothetical protein
MCVVFLFSGPFCRSFFELLAATAVRERGAGGASAVEAVRVGCLVGSNNDH